MPPNGVNGPSLSAEQHWDELIRKMDRVQYVGNILRTKRYVIYVEIVILCSSQNTWIKKDNMCLQPYASVIWILYWNTVKRHVICTVNPLVCV